MLEAPASTSVVNPKGHRMYVDPSDARGVELLRSGGDLNPYSMRLWNTALGLDAWEAVVDVGCNYGEMLVGAELPAAAAAVIAFEPNSTILPYLDRTLLEFPRPVELMRVAVAAQADQQALFAKDATWSGKSGLPAAGHVAEELDEIVMDSVRVVTLSSALGGRGYRAACVKVDVEGGEHAVLEGAREWLSSLDRWAAMIEILHMSRQQIAELVETYPFYLLDKRADALVRVQTSNLRVIERLWEGQWLYTQDALILSDRIPWS